jgi:membrane protein DedA with SNARE-associated domain
MSAALNKNFDPTLIVLSSTIGAVAGKMIIFCGSYYGRKIILSYNTQKENQKRKAKERIRSEGIKGKV